MSHVPRVAVRALLALALLLIPATASATSGPAVRYAAVGGTGSACSVDAPCSIAVATNEADDGDEVIVAPGTYRVDASLELDSAVSLHGAAGQPRPWLVGSETLDDAVLSSKRGGSLRHLGLKATSPGGDALTFQNATAEDLLLVSEQGDGGKLVGAANGTVLRDSVVHASADGASGLKLRESAGAGDVHLVNVTVMAPAGTGVRCDMTGGQATFVNTIVRGGTADVDASRATAGHCTSRASNFRVAGSPGLVSGLGDQATDPAFVDASIADYRVLGGSVTDDAGAADSLLGLADPAGCTRTLGLAPDVGAYEHADPIADPCASVPAEPLLLAPALPPAPPRDPELPHAPATDDMPGVSTPEVTDPAPVLGHSVVVAAPASGTLRVRPPGAKRFRAVNSAAPIPVGSTVDARAGRARLVSALDASGRVQTATFWGAKFVVRQPKGARGRVDLYLRGGGFSAAACRAAVAATGATATISAKRRPPRRSLWGKDRNGRYRTHGQSSAATARGTRWVTQDRCDGTLTRVLEGAVSVRDHVRHRTVLVRAGHRYLARATR